MDRDFPTYTEARTHLRSVLDAAHSRRVTTVGRDDERFAVVDAETLRTTLASLLASRAVLLAEAGGWSAFLPGMPLHGQGDGIDDALDDLCDALRDYAQDWNDGLRDVPNHRGAWALVALVELSDDAQLRDWIITTSDGRSDDADALTHA